MGLGLGIGLGLLGLGLLSWGIYACCKQPKVMMNTPMYPPPISQFNTITKQDGPILPSISTLPPNAGYSSRYMEPTIANNAYMMAGQPTSAITTTAIFPSGPSKIVEQVIGPGVVVDSPSRYATFGAYQNPSRI